MTTTEQVTTYQPDVKTNFPLTELLEDTPFAVNLLEEMMVIDGQGKEFPETAFDKIAHEILPTLSIDWKVANQKLTQKLKEVGDSAVQQCILEAVIARIELIFPDKTDGSIDFLQFHMTVANHLDKDMATITHQRLETTLKNLVLSQNDISEKRIHRQAEKHIETIIGTLHPHIITTMFPNGGYSILDNNIELEKVLPAVAEVVAIHSGDILERISMGTEDMKANQIFPAQLAKAIVEELNILRPPQTYSHTKPAVQLDENGKEVEVKTPKELFSAQLGLVIHDILSQDNPQIPRTRKVGSFNYDMPDAIADMDRLFYLGYSHLFAPAALSKLLGITEKEFLENPKYNSIIEIASQNLPVMHNPYDGHRKTTDITVFQNIVRVDREKQTGSVSEPLLLARVA